MGAVLKKEYGVGMKDINSKKPNDVAFFIGFISVAIRVLLMLCGTVPNISHEIQVDIVLYSWLFGGGGLFFLLMC